MKDSIPQRSTILTISLIAAIFVCVSTHNANGQTSRPEVAALPSGTSSATIPLKGSYEEAFRNLYDQIGKNYPCFAMKGIDWQKVGQELLPRVSQVKTDPEFALLCMELVARMEDSHATLMKGTAEVPMPPVPQWDPGFACLIDDHGEPVVYYVDKGSPAERAGVRIGMIVTSMNGKTAQDALRGQMTAFGRYLGYSSDRVLQFDAARFFPRQMERGTILRLTTRALDGQKQSFELPATLGVRYLPRSPVPMDGIPDSADVSWKMLPGNLGYIRVRRVRDDLVASLDKAVGELRSARGLVIDVRGNTGGGFDGSRSFTNFAPQDSSEPNRPRFLGPIALLIDERCISAGEGWASWFIANKRARVFGATTAGASSRKDTYTLTNGLYKVVIPVKAYAGFLDRPIERRGLEPDVPIRMKASDLAAGRDTILEAAKQYLAAAAVESGTKPSVPIHPATQPAS